MTVVLLALCLAVVVASALWVIAVLKVAPLVFQYLRERHDNRLHDQLKRIVAVEQDVVEIQNRLKKYEEEQTNDLLARRRHI